MASQLSIYKSAALLIKESPIGLALTDDTVLVNTFDEVWADVIELVLEAGKWNCAARSLTIQSDTDSEPAFGYNFAFTKPDDYANLIAISANATFYPPFGPNQYRDEGEFWFADCDPLYVSIVSSGASYGGDLSKWSTHMARYAEHELASRAAPFVASIGEQALSYLEQRKTLALRKALSWDASKQPADPLPPSRLSSARLGNRTNTWRIN